MSVRVGRHTAKCPGCRRQVPVVADKDGFGAPKFAGPFRFVEHSGLRWGRSCEGSGELAPGC